MGKKFNRFVYKASFGNELWQIKTKKMARNLNCSLGLCVSENLLAINMDLEPASLKWMHKKAQKRGFQTF